jgi:deoxycytidine triphosphate deaminase
MSILSDRDIRKLRGRDIVIEPFTDKSLSPVGYDFRVGDFVLSVEEGIISPSDGKYSLPASSTVQLLTRESIWVSHRIAGTLHSRVSLVSKGLSHVSTTLDPGWFGPLLITVRNNLKEPIVIRTNEPIVTLVFYYLRTPTRFQHHTFAFVQEIMAGHPQRTEEYIEKLCKVLGDSTEKDSFRQKVEEANQPIFKKVRKALKRQKFIRRTLIIIAIISLVLIIASTIFFIINWNTIGGLLDKPTLDFEVLAWAITFIISLITGVAALIKLLYRR